MNNKIGKEFKNIEVSFSHLGEDFKAKTNEFGVVRFTPKGSNDNYLYFAASGKVVGPFYCIGDFCCGYATCDDYNGGGCYVDQLGNLSQNFNIAMDYSYGFGVVLMDDKYYFRDVDGKLGEPFDNASSYEAGFAVVEKGKKAFYRDIKGEMFGPYDEAFDYRNGLGIVRKGQKFWYRDTKGNLSEPFEQAYVYRDGFGIAVKNHEKYYRDMSGNLSFYKTENGKVLADFYSNRISIDEINSEYFLIENFAKTIKSIFRDKMAKLIAEGITEEEAKVIKADVVAFKVIVDKKIYTALNGKGYKEETLSYIDEVLGKDK